jgi:hypothetical protein
MAKGAALFDAVVISNTEAERVRLGGVGGRDAGPIAAGTAAPAVRSGAAWFSWAVGLSCSKAATSRTPRRCVRASVSCARRTLHAAMAYVVRCHLPHNAACHVVWDWKVVQVVHWYVSRYMLQ